MSCDKYWNETVALLNFEGTDGGTTTTDETGRHTWTFAGNAHIENTWSALGSTSLQLDGTGDYLSSPDSVDSDFGTGDFTIEAFIRITGASGVADAGSGSKHMTIIGTDPATTGWDFVVLGDASASNLGLALNTKLSGVSSNVSQTYTFTLNTKYHVAVCREGTELRIFVDGTRIKTATMSANISGGATGMQIGRSATTNYYRYFNGYIDVLRVTKGICRYNADFTPLTEEPDPCLLLEEDVAEAVATPEVVAPTTYTTLADSESVTATDVSVPLVCAMWQDAIVSAISMTSQANTSSSLLSTAQLQDLAQQAILQLVAETAAGTDTIASGAAVALVDITSVVTSQVPSFSATMLVAELVAALEYYNGADGYDVTESGDLSESYVNQVDALFAMLETVTATATDTVVLHLMQAVTDTASATTVIDSEGSVLTNLLSDTALITIRLNIGGELFTGWVLNTDTLAPSEYQFADRQFNSACKHGDKYLMAAEDGIYEFTEDTSVESVMTYIKTGKTDFGSDLKKRIVNSYIVYSASGNMVLKVTTSEFGQLQTRNYRMVPPRTSETTDVRRFDIGKGIRSRYWQFELLGDGVDCDIDEIGMLPVVLSRRI